MEKKNLFFGIVIAVLVAFAGCVAKPGSEVETDRTKSGYEQTENTIIAAYKDGFYSSIVSYESPGGLDKMNVSVSLKSGVVSAISLEKVEAKEVSAGFIVDVNEALPALVVGKKLDEIALPKQISGSSLTSVAVAKYLEQVKTLAK